MLYNLALNIGWLLTLATVILAVSHVTKALIVLVSSEASELKQVSGDDAFRAIIQALVDPFGLLLQRKLALVCSFALLSLLLFLGADGLASFGYSTLAFVSVAYVSSLASAKVEVPSAIADGPVSSAHAEDPASLASAKVDSKIDSVAIATE